MMERVLGLFRSQRDVILKSLLLGGEGRKGDSKGRVCLNTRLCQSDPEEYHGGGILKSKNGD